MINTVMIDRKFFFDNVRERPFNGLEQPQVDGLNLLLDLWDKNYAIHYPSSYLAYCLATVFHETARTMRPIAEIGHGRGRAYGPTGFYGRGYVQLTWESNYAKAQKMLASHNVTVNLVGHPDQALDPKVAALILYEGMLIGMFTGKKLANYIPHDPRGARRIINGIDKADTIAGYYRLFLEAIRTNTVVESVAVSSPMPSPLPTPSTVAPPTPVVPATPAPASIAVAAQPAVQNFWSWLHTKLSRKTR